MKLRATAFAAQAPRLAAAACVLGLLVAAACVSVPDTTRMTYVGPLPNGQTVAPDFNISDFDVSADGREVVLERVQERSSVAQLDLQR